MVEGPAEYVMDVERRIIFITLSGEVRPAHLLAMQVRARQDKNFDPNLAVLLDIRNADLSILTAEDIRRLGKSSPAAKKVPRAVLIRDAVQGWLARLLQTFMEEDGRGRLEMFRDRDEAVTWLLRCNADDDCGSLEKE